MQCASGQGERANECGSGALLVGLPSAGAAQVQLPISRTKLSTTPLRGQLGRASLNMLNLSQNDGESSGTNKTFNNNLRHFETI